jgi:hypothetical protein
MRQLLLLRRSLISIRFSSYSVSSEGTIAHDWPNPPVPAENVDITIAGGGLVGSAMALAFGTNIIFLIWFIDKSLLASSPIFKNHKIVLLESQSKLPKVSKNQPYSNRVCALNSQSINLFQSIYLIKPFPTNKTLFLLSELGAWDLMKSIRSQKVARMQVEYFLLIKKY